MSSDSTRSFPGKETCRLGIDIGSMYLKLVVADKDYALKDKVYLLHQGNPLKLLREEIDRLKIGPRVSLCVTGAGASAFTSRIKAYSLDYVSALIAGVRQKFPKARNIINIGGGSVTIIHLDEKGRFLNYDTNSLCAAGTGSFLDEQANRLDIDYENQPQYSGDLPHIATRCSVFAKSDLIHHQQKGYSKEAMWLGLCRSMAITLSQTLLKGKPLHGLTVLTGGVTLNKEVCRWLEMELGSKVKSFSDAHITAALGALFTTNGAPPSEVDWERLYQSKSIKDTANKTVLARKPLLIHKSVYPDFRAIELKIDSFENEVRVSEWEENRAYDCYLGIDIGSTSTKIILITPEGQPIVDLYRKTAGDPIFATQRLFSGLSRLAAEKGSALRVLGAATTGSGRKMIGKIIGADKIINEITAHVTGALFFDPEIDTIFEIGGQDAKYMRLKNGSIHDSNMNYVCAAGTGSFVEEQAQKLGLKLDEIGDMVQGVAPPVTSDRCTVFMEQDVMKLIRQGYSQSECIGAVMYSVVQNYINKVVGKRSYSQKVFFQGATARNKGLIAAFENLLDLTVVVSPYCHVMGAMGAALMAKDYIFAGNRQGKFKGFDLAARKIDISYETCEIPCNSKCRISAAKIEGEPEKPSWGYMCGREPDSNKIKRSSHFALMKKRTQRWQNQGMVGLKLPPKAPLIAVPRNLTIYGYLPLFQHFLGRLGYRITLSEGVAAGSIIEKSNQLVGADFCCPAKFAFGHTYEAMQNKDTAFVLSPVMISEQKNENTPNSLFCPYVASTTSVVESALKLNGIKTQKLLKPIIDLSLPPHLQIKALQKEFGVKLQLPRTKIKKAWEAALKVQTAFEKENMAEGTDVISKIKQKGNKGIVLVGRPYNIYDKLINNALPHKIADLGFDVIPIDCMPFDRDNFSGEHYKMYWNYGQRIINALNQIKENPNLFCVYLSNFGCGPDSFIPKLCRKDYGR